MRGAGSRGTQLDADDVRRNTPWWTWFDNDAMAGWVDRVDAVRDVLTSGGRTLVQGALGYVWGRSARAIALPGIRTVAQARELAGAWEFGALTPEEVVEVERLAGAPSTV